MNTQAAILSTLKRSAKPLPATLITVRTQTPEPPAVIERELLAMVDHGPAHRRRHPAMRTWFFADDEAKFGEVVRFMPDAPEPDVTRENVLAFIQTHPMCSAAEIAKGLGGHSERFRDRLQAALIWLCDNGHVTRHGKLRAYRYMPKLEGRS